MKRSRKLWVILALAISFWLGMRFQRALDIRVISAMSETIGTCVDILDGLGINESPEPRTKKPTRWI
jgi:hypothetical protein